MSFVLFLCSVSCGMCPVLSNTSVDIVSMWCHVKQLCSLNLTHTHTVSCVCLACLGVSVFPLSCVVVPQHHSSAAPHHHKYHDIIASQSRTTSCSPDHFWFCVGAARRLKEYVTPCVPCSAYSVKCSVSCVMCAVSCVSSCVLCLMFGPLSCVARTRTRRIVTTRFFLKSMMLCRKEDHLCPHGTLLRCEHSRFLRTAGRSAPAAVGPSCKGVLCLLQL